MLYLPTVCTCFAVAWSDHVTGSQGFVTDSTPGDLKCLDDLARDRVDFCSAQAEGECVGACDALGKYSQEEWPLVSSQEGRVLSVCLVWLLPTV